MFQRHDRYLQHVSSPVASSSLGLWQSPAVPAAATPQQLGWGKQHKAGTKHGVSVQQHKAVKARSIKTRRRAQKCPSKDGENAQAKSCKTECAGFGGTSIMIMIDYEQHECEQIGTMWPFMAWILQPLTRALNILPMWPTWTQKMPRNHSSYIPKKKKEYTINTIVLDILCQNQT